MVNVTTVLVNVLKSLPVRIALLMLSFVLETVVTSVVNVLLKDASA